MCLGLVPVHHFLGSGRCVLESLALSRFLVHVAAVCDALCVTDLAFLIAQEKIISLRIILMLLVDRQRLALTVCSWKLGT
jgi:hypothetical protein